MFAYLMNNGYLNAKTIIIKYYKPGHTFMAADAGHSKIEEQKRKMVYHFIKILLSVLSLQAAPQLKWT